MFPIKYYFKTILLVKNPKELGINNLIFSILITGLILAFLLDLALGSVQIPIQKVITILLGEQAEKPIWTTIILKFRLPKALTATFSGAALGVSGLQMQTGACQVGEPISPLR